MSLPSVYLAGGMDSGWRDQATYWWGGKVITINPFEDSPQGSIAEFTGSDLDQIRQCNLLFGCLNYPRYTGMALEFGFAHALEIPCVYVHLEGGRIDSMMAGVSAAVFTDLKAALEFCDKKFF